MTTEVTSKTLDRRSFLYRTLAASGGLILPGKSRLWAAEPAGKFGEVSRYIGSQVMAGVVPGAGVLVSQRGKMIHEQYWGTCCTHDSYDEPFEGSVVNVCFSFSKLISATVIMMLVQDGVLALDVPVMKYIPQFKGGGKDRITLRHLLTHSAGIPAVPIKAVGTQAEWDEAVRTVCEAQVAWEPGSRCQYHALTGLFVAAEAAQRVTGTKWNELCKTKLFEPLGATSMSFELPPQGSCKLSVVPRPDANALKSLNYGESYASWLLGHPAGSCFATPADILKVMQLHLGKGKWEGRTLIKPQVFKEMHTVQYARQIAAAAQARKASAHQSWGLGPLLRGTGPAEQGHAWFGFGDRRSPGIFGHAGISTIIGVGDPSLDLAIVFITTDKPNPDPKATELRNGVTNRAFKAFGG